MKSINRNVPIFNIDYDKNGHNTINIKEVRYNNKFHNIDHSMNRLQFLRKVTCSINDSTLNDSKLSNVTVPINPYINNGNNENEWHLCTLYIEPGRYGSYEDIIREINKSWNETYNNIFNVNQVATIGYEGVGFDTTKQQSILLNKCRIDKASVSPLFGDSVAMLCKRGYYKMDNTGYSVSFDYLLIPRSDSLIISNGVIKYPNFLNNSFQCDQIDDGFKLSGSLASTGNYLTSFLLSDGTINGIDYYDTELSMWNSSDESVVSIENGSTLRLGGNANIIRIIGHSDSEPVVYEGRILNDISEFINDPEGSYEGDLDDLIMKNVTESESINVECSSDTHIGAKLITDLEDKRVYEVTSSKFTIKGVEYTIDGDEVKQGSEKISDIVNNHFTIDNVQYVYDGAVRLSEVIYPDFSRDIIDNPAAYIKFDRNSEVNDNIPFSIKYYDMESQNIKIEDSNPMWKNGQMSYGSASFIGKSEYCKGANKIGDVAYSVHGDKVIAGTIYKLEGDTSDSDECHPVDVSSLVRYTYDSIDDPVELSSISSQIGSVKYKIDVNNRLVEVAKFLNETVTFHENASTIRDDVRCATYSIPGITPSFDGEEIYIPSQIDSRAISKFFYEYKATDSVFRRVPQYDTSSHTDLARRIDGNVEYKVSTVTVSSGTYAVDADDNTIVKGSNKLFKDGHGQQYSYDEIDKFNVSSALSNHKLVISSRESNENLQYFIIVHNNSLDGTKRIVSIFKHDFEASGSFRLPTNGINSWKVNKTGYELTSLDVDPVSDNDVLYGDSPNINQISSIYTMSDSISVTGSSHFAIRMPATLQILVNIDALYRDSTKSVANHDYSITYGHNALTIDVSSSSYQNCHFMDTNRSGAVYCYVSIEYLVSESQSLTLSTIWTTTSQSGWICENETGDGSVALGLTYKYNVYMSNNVATLYERGVGTAPSFDVIMFGSDEKTTTRIFKLSNFERTADIDEFYIPNPNGSDSYRYLENDNTKAALLSKSNLYKYYIYEEVSGANPYDPYYSDCYIKIAAPLIWSGTSKSDNSVIEESDKLLNPEDFPDGIYYSRFTGDTNSYVFAKIGNTYKNIVVSELTTNVDIGSRLTHLYTVESDIVHYDSNVKFYPIIQENKYVKYDHGAYVHLTSTPTVTYEAVNGVIRPTVEDESTQRNIYDDNGKLKYVCDLTCPRERLESIYVLESSLIHLDELANNSIEVTEFYSGNLSLGGIWSDKEINYYGLNTEYGFLNCDSDSMRQNAIIVYSGNNQYEREVSQVSTSKFTVYAELSESGVSNYSKSNSVTSYDIGNHSDIIQGPFEHDGVIIYIIYGFTIKFNANNVTVSYHDNSASAQLNDLSSAQLSTSSFSAIITRNETNYVFSASANDNMSSPYSYKSRTRKQCAEYYEAKGYRMTNYITPPLVGNKFVNSMATLNYRKYIASVEYDASVGVFQNTDPSELISSQNASFYEIIPETSISLAFETYLGKMKTRVTSGVMNDEYDIIGNCVIDTNINSITFTSDIILEGNRKILSDQTINVERNYLKVIMADSFSGYCDQDVFIRDNVTEVVTVNKVAKKNNELKFDNYFNLSSESFVSANNIGKNKIELIFNSSIIPVVPSSSIDYFDMNIEDYYEDNTTDLMPRIISLEGGEYRVNESMISVYNNKFNLIDKNYHKYNDNPRTSLWDIMGIDPCIYDYKDVVKFNDQPIHMIAGKYYTEDLYVGDAYPKYTLRVPSTRKIISNSESILNNVEYFNKTTHKGAREINMKVPRKLKLYVYPTEAVAELSLNQIDTRDTRALAEYDFETNIVEGTNGCMPIGVQMNLDVGQSISLLLTSDEQKYLLVPDNDTELFYSRS